MMDFLLFLLPLSVAGNVAWLLTAIRDTKEARKREITMEKKIRMLEDEVWRYKCKKYRKVVRFLNPHDMPQNRLDAEITTYQEDGWTFDDKYSVNGLLAFYKEEEIKGD